MPTVCKKVGISSSIIIAVIVAKIGKRLKNGSAFFMNNYEEPGLFTDRDCCIGNEVALEVVPPTPLI